MTHQVLINKESNKTYSPSPLSLPGNIYIADENNHRIRKVFISTGLIATIAGTGASSYSGDNGAATSAAIRKPRSVELDSSGTHTMPQVSFFITFSL